MSLGVTLVDKVNVTRCTLRRQCAGDVAHTLLVIPAGAKRKAGTQYPLGCV